ncbi:hypothetical protein Lser_V15G01632 [Lactuca serriola]
MAVEQSNHSLTFHEPSMEQSISFITELQWILCYASPYPQMLQPAYPQMPIGAVGVIPSLARPPMMAMRGPVVPTIIRRPVNTITPAEKPMTIVYVGKIASSVENEFMLSLFLCGPLKSWKHVPDPTTGALKGFGFCEFRNVEGVLRALRLLSKLSIGGQELMVQGGTMKDKINCIREHGTQSYFDFFSKNTDETLMEIEEAEIELDLIQKEQSVEESSNDVTDWRKLPFVYFENPSFLFGVSYAGALSAWFCLKFPHLTSTTGRLSQGPDQAQGISSVPIPLANLLGMYQIKMKDYIGFRLHLVDQLFFQS